MLVGATQADCLVSWLLLATGAGPGRKPRTITIVIRLADLHNNLLSICTPPSRKNTINTNNKEALMAIPESWKRNAEWIKWIVSRADGFTFQLRTQNGSLKMAECGGIELAQREPQARANKFRIFLLVREGYHKSAFPTNWHCQENSHFKSQSCYFFIPALLLPRWLVSWMTIMTSTTNSIQLFWKKQFSHISFFFSDHKLSPLVTLYYSFCLLDSQTY